MAIGDVYAVTLTWDLDGQRLQNVLHFKETTAETTAPAAFALIEALNVDFMVALCNCISQSCVLTTMYARRVKPTPDIPYLFLASGGSAAVGARGVAVCPPQAALLFSFYAVPAGPRARGRLYLPGCAEGDQDSGRITPELLAIMETTRDTMLEDIGPLGANTGVWDLAIFSRAANAADTVDVCVAHTNLATVRSRRAYAGTS